MSDSEVRSSEPATVSDLSGRQLGDYRLLRRLGRGAMAEVYLAEQGSLRRQVAVKVLKRDLATDASYIHRFQNEARAAASLVHANIVQIHEVGCVDGIHYIVQEYVAGQNLRELLARRGPPDARLAVSIMRQVAAALCKAAEQGIIHRDIKPENIMLAASGEVKVADFGLARVSGQGGTLNLTQAGVTMGTPLYMSPEQVEGKPLDSRSDIYSFGVTCYHMLAGEPPFRGDTALSVALQHLKVQPDRLEIVRPDLPGALCRIVHQMLGKEPAERYADPRALLRDLRRLRIDGLEDDPVESPVGEDDLDTARMPASAATERLATVMQTMALPASRPRVGRWLTIAALIGVLLGGAMARSAREPWLLAGADPQRSHIDRQETALAQYIYASTLNTEEAWLSVAEHFPDRTFYVRLANQQLARIYLQKGNDQRALELFEEFADLNETEQKFRAFGLAGKCIVLSLRRQHAESTAVLAELLPLRDQLDSQMSRMLAFAIEANHAAMSEQNANQWKAWLAERTAEEEG